MKRKTLLAGFFGNIMEWYDFTVYGFFAGVIGATFFPPGDKIVALLGAFGVFAAGYFMRPLGGIIFGHVGDKHGRKRALFFSILLMAIPTTLIGLLPTYAQVGWYSTLLLVILRLAQGLSVGGEFTGSISFLVENAPSKRRGYFGSWTTFGVLGGMLLGSLVATIVVGLLSSEQLHEFGWRIPFLLGAVIGLSGVLLRRNMESVAEEKNKMTPIMEFWKNFKLDALRVILVSWGFGVSVYLILIYMPTYLSSFLNVSPSIALSTHTVSLVVMLVIIPPLGLISDRVGRKIVLLLAMAGFVVLTLPLFYVFMMNIYLAILAAMLVFVLLQGMLQAALPAFMAEVFPHRIRYTAMSVSYNIALALFGGTAPLVATWLIQITGNVLMPAYYLMLSAGIALLTLLFMKDHSNDRLS
ncbi:MAG: MHS family MFS transporter [Euryarchaeota archaeon]|nr:MHS family MFS transporter [Euryarchaeota archaeon]